MKGRCSVGNDPLVYGDLVVLTMHQTLAHVGCYPCLEPGGQCPKAADPGRIPWSSCACYRTRPDFNIKLRIEET